MTIEHDETDEVAVPEVDPINAAACPLFEVIFAHSRDGSPERKAAMKEVLAACERDPCGAREADTELRGARTDV